MIKTNNLTVWNVHQQAGYSSLSLKGIQTWYTPRRLGSVQDEMVKWRLLSPVYQSHNLSVYKSFWLFETTLENEKINLYKNWKPALPLFLSCCDLDWFTLFTANIHSDSRFKTWATILQREDTQLFLFKKNISDINRRDSVSGWGDTHRWTWAGIWGGGWADGSPEFCHRWGAWMYPVLYLCWVGPDVIATPGGGGTKCSFSRCMYRCCPLLADAS